MSEYDEKLMAAGFDHPCKDKCSGWQQGYDRAVFDAKMIAANQAPVMHGGDHVANDIVKHIEKLKEEIRRLNRVIARELSENDELGCEYTYVNALRQDNRKFFDALVKYDDLLTALMDKCEKEKLILKPSGVDELRQIARKALLVEP